MHSWRTDVRFQRPRTRHLALAAGALAALLFTGCSSDDGDEPQNATPVAHAGPAQNVTAGDVVTLDGSGSTDADGDTLTYAWTLTTRPAGSAAALSSATAVHPTFTADVEGAYVARLVVSDGQASSAPSTVTITAAAGNSAPVADAGPDQNVTAGDVVTLDGSGSTDTDGDPLTYTWSLTTVPAGSAAALSSTTAAGPTFTADLEGTYVASLVVSDGALPSTADTVTITAAAGNSAPVADAGPDQDVAPGALVTLDGTASHDADGDPLTYTWSLTTVPDGSTAALSDPAVASPTFTADLAGTYVAQLVVSDGTASSAPETVSVVAALTAPVANAGAEQLVTPGDLVTLDGSGSSDPNGDPLTYQWTLVDAPAGSTAALSDASAASPTFTADLAGGYLLQLVVSDGTEASPPANVAVWARTTTSFVPTVTFFDGYLGALASGNYPFLAQASVVALPPIRFYNPADGRLRLFDGGGTYAINYNGSSIAAGAPFVGGETITVGDLTRWVSIPYEATPGPVTLNLVHTYSSTCAAAQIMILDVSGRVLHAASACDTASPMTFTHTDPANTEFIVAFSRITDAGGGLRIWSADLTR